MLRSKQTNKNKKDKKEREKYCNNEIKYKIVKTIKENEILKKNIQEKYTSSVNKLKIKNRCIITGKARRVIKKINISTITLKEMVNDNKIENIKKK